MLYFGTKTEIAKASQALKSKASYRYNLRMC